MTTASKHIIRIGTRGSRLALWQTHHVAELLNAAGLETEVVVISTKGDQILDRSLDKIGSKGVFTEELEESLRNGDVDIAVHSAKDLQSSIPDDLEIMAFMEREQVNDVVISFNSDFKLRDDAQLVIGTSSTRRKAILKRLYPNVITSECRGNLQTRLKKLEDKNYDAILLAYAGVHRMHYDHLIVEHLSEEVFIPAAGQGSIAVECAVNLDPDKKEKLKQALDHEPTHACLATERAFLRTMEGGCSIPSFALATLQNDQISITGGIISLDGQEMIKETMQAPKQEAEVLGHKLAQKVLSLGGDKILESIKKERNL